MTYTVSSGTLNPTIPYLSAYINVILMADLRMEVIIYRYKASPRTETSQCSTAVRTVVRATQQVNGKWSFSGCQNSVTPEPID